MLVEIQQLTFSLILLKCHHNRPSVLALLVANEPHARCRPRGHKQMTQRCYCPLLLA